VTVAAIHLAALFIVLEIRMFLPSPDSGLCRRMTGVVSPVRSSQVVGNNERCTFFTALDRHCRRWMTVTTISLTVLTAEIQE